MMIDFYSAWFCPYAQRAWITLEHHKIPYNYIESLTVKENQNEGNHGYDKTPRLLELNPKGLVPTLNLLPEAMKEKGIDAEKIGITKDPKVKINEDDGSYVVVDSIPCVELLNELSLKLSNSKEDGILCTNLISDPILTSDAKKYDKSICSTFYKILMKPTREEQKDAYASFTKSISEFLAEVEGNGFFKSEHHPTIVDYVVIPWILRIIILDHYRPMFQLKDYLHSDDIRKLKDYTERMKQLPSVKATLWQDESNLLQVYERYADGTAQSQVGQAVRSGKDAHDV